MYKNMLRDVGVENLPEPADRVADQRMLLSTRCRQAINRSKAHALPAARRRHHRHVRIILRNLLTVPSVPRNIGGWKFRYEDREALSVYQRFILQCNQHPKCTASRTISEQCMRHLGAVRACGLPCYVGSSGQYEPVAHLALWARQGESVSTKLEHQSRAQESYLSVEPVRVAPKKKLKRKTKTNSVNTPHPPRHINFDNIGVRLNTPPHTTHNTTAKIHEHTHHATSMFFTCGSSTTHHHTKKSVNTPTSQKLITVAVTFAVTKV